jgi:hypothetical protein
METISPYCAISAVVLLALLLAPAWQSLKIKEKNQ